jgi:outer membrane protein TolC
MRWFVGLAILAVTAAASLAGQQTTAPAAAPVEVTLSEAIDRALQVQPAMVQARGDQRNAGSGMWAAYGEFLPTVTTGGSYARAGGTRLNTQTNQIVSLPAGTTFQGNINASVDLFRGFKRFGDRSAAYATQDAADAGVVNQRFQVTLATKQAFYNALANEELVRVAQSQVTRAQQELQISIDKLHAGSATRSDSLRSTVDYGNARIALLQAQANLATAQANLGRQIGVNQSVRAVPDSALPELPDTSVLRTSAVQNSPIVEQAEAQARAAGAQVTINRSSYMPSISAAIGNSYSGLDAPWTSNSKFASGWSARITASWTLFDGFSRERQMTTARVARDVAEARAADARLQVSAQLTQQLAALQTTYEQISIARDNLAAATEDLRVQNERYRVGAATILDLLTSQAALTQAEVNVVQTRFNYLIARAQVEAVVGRSL